MEEKEERQETYVAAQGASQMPQNQKKNIQAVERCVGHQGSISRNSKKLQGQNQGSKGKN